MYNLLVLLNCNTNNVLLSYKNQKEAYEAANIIDQAMFATNERLVSLEDDFSRRASIEVRSIASHLVINLDKEMECQAAQAIIKHRADQKHRVAMASDPVTRLVGSMQ